ncbi:MAG: NifB/NifX family molybdenum-iron cluster-binding protein [Candidatus Cloacimonadota bacterium]|nr:NifB/NifX family molybdenum-iron cluster-binding protein [Candidatus Cloacimonadota bacterium]
MKFAIPTQFGKLCDHFGHCEKFAIVETNDGKIEGESYLEPPVHQPGAYPQFLAEQGVDVIIAGGLGNRAQALFRQYNIELYVGVSQAEPTELVKAYLKGDLDTGSNLCDH